MLTVTARALGNAAVHWQSSVLETLQVLISARWPNILLILATGLVTKVKSNLVLPVKLAL